MTTIMTNASVSSYFPSPSRSLSLWLHFPKFYFTIMTSFCASPLPSIKVSFFTKKGLPLSVSIMRLISGKDILDLFGGHSFGLGLKHLILQSTDSIM